MISKSQLQQQGALVFDYITEGLNNYNNEIILMDAKEAYVFFMNQWHKSPNAYIDFYFSSLESSSQEAVLSVLDEDEKAYVQTMESSGIYFQMTEPLLKIATKLNAAEMLFCTIYFADISETYWGNYKEQYVRFWCADKDKI